MKKIRTAFRWCVGIGFAGIICALAVNFLVIGIARQYIVEPQDTADDYDCILVLGCQVHGDAPSAMLRDRLDRAIELYKSGVSDRILMSGDHGRTEYNEVGVMKQYAIDNGVPADAVFMDHAGFSTYESMYRARDIFEVRHPLIVTQTYHLYRAIYDARRLGLDAQGTDAMPNTYVFPMYNTVREILARNKDFLYAAIRPKPTCLGEPIPISRSGSMTDDQEFVEKI